MIHYLHVQYETWLSGERLNVEREGSVLGLPHS